MDELVGIMSRGSADARSPGPFKQYSVQTAHKRRLFEYGFPGGGVLCEKPLQKIGFRRALLLMKPAHTGHHPGAVPGFRPSPGNSEETTTRVLTEEISVLFRVPTWDPTHPGSPGSRALPGNTPTQGPTREGKPGFFLGGGGNPGRNPGHGLGKTRERGGFRVFPGWYCWGLDSPGHFPTPGGRFEDQFGSVQADFGQNSSPAGFNSSRPAGSKSSPPAPAGYFETRV